MKTFFLTALMLAIVFSSEALARGYQSTVVAGFDEMPNPYYPPGYYYQPVQTYPEPYAIYKGPSPAYVVMPPNGNYAYTPPAIYPVLPQSNVMMAPR